MFSSLYDTTAFPPGMHPSVLQGTWGERDSSARAGGNRERTAVLWIRHLLVMGLAGRPAVKVPQGACTAHAVTRGTSATLKTFCARTPTEDAHLVWTEHLEPGPAGPSSCGDAACVFMLDAGDASAVATAACRPEATKGGQYRIRHLTSHAARSLLWKSPYRQAASSMLDLAAPRLQLQDVTTGITQRVHCGRSKTTCAKASSECGQLRVASEA